jgi:hypothetical protein
MTSTLPHPNPATPRTPSGRERLYDVDLVGGDPAALVRVLTTLRRRCCTITHVEFDVGDRHRPGLLTIGLEPPVHHARGPRRTTTSSRSSRSRPATRAARRSSRRRPA